MGMKRQGRSAVERKSRERNREIPEIYPRLDRTTDGRVGKLDVMGLRCGLFKRALRERIRGRKRYKPHWLISCTYLDTGESFTDDDGPDRESCSPTSFPYSVRS